MPKMVSLDEGQQVLHWRGGGLAIFRCGFVLYRCGGYLTLCWRGLVLRWRGGGLALRRLANRAGAFRCNHTLIGERTRPWGRSDRRIPVVRARAQGGIAARRLHLLLLACSRG